MLLPTAAISLPAQSPAQGVPARWICSHASGNAISIRSEMRRMPSFAPESAVSTPAGNDIDSSVESRSKPDSAAKSRPASRGRR